MLHEVVIFRRKIPTRWGSIFLDKASHGTVISCDMEAVVDPLVTSSLLSGSDQHSHIIICFSLLSVAVQISHTKIYKQHPTTLLRVNRVSRFCCTEVSTNLILGFFLIAVGICVLAFGALRPGKGKPPHSKSKIYQTRPAHCTSFPAF